MKTLLIKLAEQIADNIEYLNLAGHYCADTFSLVQLNKYPFFNVLPNPVNSIEVIESSNINIASFERYIYNVIIQFATRNLAIKVALLGDDKKNIKGLFTVYEDIYEAIKKDTTIDGCVNGLLPGSSINFDVAQENVDKYFIAVGEINLKFYKDIGLKK